MSAEQSIESGVFEYPPVGCCIYCGAVPAESEPRLGDEHLFAYALGGGLVLPRASCQRCAETINQEIESPILRGPTSMLGRFHAQFGIKSRSRTGDELYPLRLEVEGVEQVVNLRIDDYPAVPVAFPAFGLPGIMRVPPSDKFCETRWLRILPAVADNQARLARLEERMGGKPCKVTIDYHTRLRPFTRMLAKIAHSSAVATFGLDGFEPFLPDVILGRNPAIGHFVGCIEGAPMRSVKTAHQIQYGLPWASDRTYLGAAVRLYKSLDTPTYLVVVGKPSEKTERVLRAFPLPLAPLAFGAPSSQREH
jgi:hypothetical protein